MFNSSENNIPNEENKLATIATNNSDWTWFNEQEQPKEQALLDSISHEEKEQSNNTQQLLLIKSTSNLLSHDTITIERKRSFEDLDIESNKKQKLNYHHHHYSIDSPASPAGPASSPSSPSSPAVLLSA